MPTRSSPMQILPPIHTYDSAMKSIKRFIAVRDKPYGLIRGKGSIADTVFLFCKVRNRIEVSVMPSIPAYSASVDRQYCSACRSIKKPDNRSRTKRQGYPAVLAGTVPKNVYIQGQRLLSIRITVRRLF